MLAQSWRRDRLEIGGRVDVRERGLIGKHDPLGVHGVHECTHAAFACGEEFGDPRFHQFVQKSGKISSRKFVDELTAALDRHRGSAPPHDDITIVTFLLEPKTADRRDEDREHEDADTGAPAGQHDRAESIAAGQVGQ